LDFGIALALAYVAVAPFSRSSTPRRTGLLDPEDRGTMLLHRPGNYIAINIM
jgi:hypothetical protein